MYRGTWTPGILRHIQIQIKAEITSDWPRNPRKSMYFLVNLRLSTLGYVNLRKSTLIHVNLRLPI